jgi:hypothetical protein
MELLVLTSAIGLSVAAALGSTRAVLWILLEVMMRGAPPIDLGQ